MCRAAQGTTSRKRRAAPQLLRTDLQQPHIASAPTATRKMRRFTALEAALFAVSSFALYGAWSSSQSAHEFEQMLKTCQTSLHHELHAPHAPPEHDNAAANTVTPLPADREAGLFGKRQWPWHKHLHGAPLTRFTADGNRCQLPFKYKGRMYHDCTPEPSARCPLTPPGANAVTDDELDGVCAPNYNFAALKANFENEVYTRIGLAKDGRMGVGVVAVRDIPKDKEPFQLPDGQSCGVGEYVNFPESALKHIPKGVVARVPQAGGSRGF